MNRIRKKIFMAGGAMLLLAACSTAAVKPDAPVRILAQGSHSGVRQQEYHDLHNIQEFQRWWTQAYSTHGAVPALPQVDFSRDMVVAVFMGEKSHGGYSLQVTNVAPTPDSYDIEITVTVPGPDCRTTQALIQPFEFVAVPDSRGRFVNWDVKQRYLTCKS